MRNTFCWTTGLLPEATKIIRLRHKIYTTLTKTFTVFVMAFFVTGVAYGQNPTANFTSSVVSGCAPLTVNFTDQSGGSPTSWNWEFSNGTLTSIQNPVVTFSTPGTYSVKLVVQNANGIDQVERIDYITVFPAPTANFTSNLTLGCAPAVINFTDQSTTATGTITSWEWDFGDGTGTSAVQNPTHTFTSTGFYSITLIVTSSTGCRNIITRNSYIRVVDGITTDFNFTPPETCRPPFTGAFQNQSSGPGNISYTWDFGNGQTSTATAGTTVYNAPGSYTVRLNAQSDLGCTGSIQKVITIPTTVTDFTVPANICLSQPVTFQNASSPPPLSSAWNFGDGSTAAQINPTKIFLVAGTFDVKLINTYAGCMDSANHTITVTDKPIINFTADDDSACSIPFNVQFTDLSPGAVAWQWDFGDGNSSTAQNPSHQYTAFGKYPVTLTITTSTGCINTVTKDSLINIVPTEIGLNLPAGGCAPFIYTPVADITTIDPVVSYAWDLGEPGATFNVQNPPPYTYNSPGTFDITLTVTTASGCVVTRTVPGGVRVGVLPVVDFIPKSGDQCASDTVFFHDLTVFPPVPNSLHEWDWDFGDGTNSPDQDPSHVFQDTGTRTVKLTVYNNRCPAFISYTFVVRPPVAKFTHTYDCTTNQATFTDASIIDPAILPITYFWDFGNGQTSAVQNPPPIPYPSPGKYYINLTVTNGPCSYTRLDSLLIPNEPATFTAVRNPVCKNEAFTLTANANPANITSYRWVVGVDTLPGTTKSVTHTLSATGPYDVTLILTDINGCITINKIPNYLTVNGSTANFSPANIGACLNKPIAFTDLSTPAGGISNWHFDFGDSTQQDYTSGPFTHTYSKVGGYIVALTITDLAGCKDTYTRLVSLLVTNPLSGFMADTFYCPQAPLQFTDTSGGGTNFTHLWDFGDGGTSTDQHPLHNFPAGDADYTVKLKITDISGCTDSVTKVNYIRIRKPKAAFDIRDTATICPPLNTRFTFKGADYKTFTWDFGDGGTLNGNMNPNHFYSGSGTYTPKLYVYGPGGCVDSAKSSVTIYNPNTSASIAAGPITTACNSLNVDFNITVPPGFKYLFYFGDGSVDSTRRLSFSHFYPRPSLNQTILVILDTIAGCQAALFGNPRIDVLGAIPLFSPDKKEFCDNGSVTFEDFTTKNEPIISTVWDFGDGSTSNAQEPTHSYAQPGIYPVTLNVITQSNCPNSYTDTLYVYRTPVPAIVSRDTICVGIAEPINAMLAQPDTLTNWKWTFGNGQTSTQQNNSITFATPGDYTLELTATNKIGCSNTITKNIYVTAIPSASPVQTPLTIISGGSTNLPMKYTGNIVSYSWQPPLRLSCIDCPAPIANPQFTTQYTVQVADRYGCRNSGDITVIVVCNNQNFFVPNTFSPNGDGQNEAFFPRGTGLFRIKSMTIFNRWGQVVFDRKDMPVNDPSAGWNGTFNGQKASPDVYVYMLEILCDNNTVIPIKGNVTLLR